MPGVLSTLGRPRPTSYLIRPTMLLAGSESIKAGDCSPRLLSLQGELLPGKHDVENTFRTLAVICLDPREKGVLDSRPALGQLPGLQ